LYTARKERINNCSLFTCKIQIKLVNGKKILLQAIWKIYWELDQTKIFQVISNKLLILKMIFLNFH